MLGISPTWSTAGGAAWSLERPWPKHGRKASLEHGSFLQHVPRGSLKNDMLGTSQTWSTAKGAALSFELIALAETRP